MYEKCFISFTSRRKLEAAAILARCYQVQKQRTKKFTRRSCTRTQRSRSLCRTCRAHNSAPIFPFPPAPIDREVKVLTRKKPECGSPVLTRSKYRVGWIIILLQ
ncbi:unnamed protein product [Amoebophrya sp. A120]|nr:unnamed protein product [Amoebophrya sp. A120]|eukprot:GSA120T00023039001.1